MDKNGQELVNKKLFVVILNYNTADLTFDCIDSLIDTETKIEYEIIIVDNKSNDDEFDRLLNKFDKIQHDQQKIILHYKEKGILLLVSPENFGFSAGNNIALRYIYNHFKDCNIAIVNSDIIFYEKDTFFRLIKDVCGDERNGVVMPMVWNIHSKIKNPEYQIQIRKNLDTAFDVLIECSPIFRKIFFIKFNELMYKKYQPYTKTMECDVVSGACFLMLNNFVKHKFLFDEGVFLYNEEYMLSKYLQEIGYKSIFVPQVKVKHLQGMSGEKKQKFSLIYYKYKIQAQIYYLRKYLLVSDVKIFFYKVFKIFEGYLIYLILCKKIVYKELRDYAGSIIKI